MTYRIREAMKPDNNEPPLGGEGKVEKSIAELQADYAQHVERQQFHAEEAKKMADLLTRLGIRVH